MFLLIKQENAVNLKDCRFDGQLRWVSEVIAFQLIGKFFFNVTERTRDLICKLLHCIFLLSLSIMLGRYYLYLYLSPSPFLINFQFLFFCVASCTLYTAFTNKLREHARAEDLILAYEILFFDIYYLKLDRCPFE